jgi:hypothetical protein
MSEVSLCWHCRHAWHDGACASPDGFEAARHAAEGDLRRRSLKLEQDLKLFVGFQLRGFLNGDWSVRTPKDKVLSAKTPEALLELVRKAAGKARPEPVQAGFVW